MEEKYIVLDCKGFTGLTIGSYSRKPGYIFSKREWNFGEDSLKNAIAVGRCKLVEVKEEKKEKPVKSKSDEKPIKLDSEKEKGFFE